jgi:hypothetical protein
MIISQCQPQSVGRSSDIREQTVLEEMEVGTRRPLPTIISSGIPSWVRGSMPLLRKIMLCSIGSKSKLIRAIQMVKTKSNTIATNAYCPSKQGMRPCGAWSKQAVGSTPTGKVYFSLEKPWTGICPQYIWEWCMLSWLLRASAKEFVKIEIKFTSIKEMSCKEISRSVDYKGWAITTTRPLARSAIIRNLPRQRIS